MSHSSLSGQPSKNLVAVDLEQFREVDGSAVEEVAFPNALSQFVFTRTYPRWRDDLGRRETFVEATDRYVGFLAEERDVPADVQQKIRSAMLKMDVVPSMRAFWSAGAAARRDHTMIYNCSFIPLDSLRSFSELLYILMMGTGVGYSVEKEFVNNLPVVADDTGEDPIHYLIDDSTVGWMDSLFDGMTHLYKGRKVDFDFSQIRLEGARLKTKGGRASGPKPLRNLLMFVTNTINGARGRKLTTVECNDIACMIGEIVMAGGVRRAALISFSDPSDELMRDAKKFPVCKECGYEWAVHLSEGNSPDGHLMKEHGMTEEEYLQEYPDAYLGFGHHRFMANNSAFWMEKPSLKTFAHEWTALKESGSGERGFYMFPPGKRAERRSDCRSNPCGEILLRYSKSTDPWTGEGGGGQFCNLSAAVMRSEDTRETFAEKIRIATWIGALQATFTDFPHLRPAWKKHCDEDRLLGVDITGHCDNPALSGDEEAMLYFNRIARETAAQASSHLGIPMPVSITCGKPSGNSSQVLDCASGFHTRYAPFYIRRVRIASSDPLFHLIRDSGVPVHKDNKYANVPDSECPTWVAEFPVKSPAGAMTRVDETAIQQLERYLQVMRTWISERGHNQSATVYVREDEWSEVGAWVFKHFDEITGLSFLPYDGGKYQLAPYEEITEEEYNRLMAVFPEVDYSLLTSYEKEDMGNGAQVLACVGGACEIDWETLAAETAENDDVSAVVVSAEGNMAHHEAPKVPNAPAGCKLSGNCGNKHSFDCAQCMGLED